MKLFTLFLISTLIATNCIAISDDATAPDNLTSPIIGGGKGKKGRKKRAEEITLSSSKDPKKISGQCTISSEEPLSAAGGAGPCIDMALQLEGANTKVILYTRTDKAGHFEFLLPGPDQYSLKTTSKFYQVMSPTEPISKGGRVDIHLKQR